MTKFKDLRDKKYGKLTVINEKPIRKNNQTLWKCRCDCGNEKYIFSSNLISGKTVSCGCSKYRDRHKKSFADKKLIATFQRMKRRCYNPNDVSYKNYGARGITICSEWLNDSMEFYKWSYKNGYDSNLKPFECTIDRIDVNGNYEPSNCRWVSMKIQQNNKRNNRRLTIGNDTKTISQWAEIYGITHDGFAWRYKHNKV